MPIYQRIKSFDDEIRRLKTPPIILNELVELEENGEPIDVHSLIYDNFSGDVVSAVPSCECGKTQGEFSVGLKCEHCGTSVKSHVYEDIQPLIWFRKPQDISGIINPAIWTMLYKRFDKQGFNVLLWLCDTTYTPKKDFLRVISILENNGIQRGYNFFVDNFDKIIDVLFNIKDLPSPKGKQEWLKTLIVENRDAVFSEYLPLPNKSLLIVETTNVGVYVDNTVVDAINPIQILMTIDSQIKKYSTRIKENRLCKAINGLSQYFLSFYYKILSQKRGLFRKHFYATRTHFSFRAVISSITDPHSYDEIHIPWQAGITLLKFHLINKLMRKYGYDYNNSIGYLYSKMYCYDFLLDTLFKELISESPYGGIPATAQRNPTLTIGSMQLFRILKVKTDPNDQTLGIPITNVTAFNADFDGDEMNSSLMVDNFMLELFSSLEPDNNVFSLDSPPLEVSSFVALPKPSVSTITNWLYNQDEPDTVPYELINLLKED